MFKIERAILDLKLSKHVADTVEVLLVFRNSPVGPAEDKTVL